MDDKRANFVTTAEGRTNRAIKNIQLIADLADPKKYQYTMDDVQGIKQAIMDALDSMEASYKVSQRSEFKL